MFEDSVTASEKGLSEQRDSFTGSRSVGCELTSATSALVSLVVISVCASSLLKTSTKPATSHLALLSSSTSIAATLSCDEEQSSREHLLE